MYIWFPHFFRFEIPGLFQDLLTIFNDVCSKDLGRPFGHNLSDNNSRKHPGAVMVFFPHFSQEIQGLYQAFWPLLKIEGLFQAIENGFFNFKFKDFSRVQRTCGNHVYNHAYRRTHHDTYALVNVTITSCRSVDCHTFSLIGLYGQSFAIQSLPAWFYSLPE